MPSAKILEEKKAVVAALAEKMKNANANWPMLLITKSILATPCTASPKPTT